MKWTEAICYIYLLFSLCSSCIIGQSEHETFSVPLSVLLIWPLMFVWKQLCVTQRTQNAPQVAVWLVGKCTSVNEVCMVLGVRRECLHISQRPISVAFHCAKLFQKGAKTWRLLIQGRQNSHPSCQIAVIVGKADLNPDLRFLKK